METVVDYDELSDAVELLLDHVAYAHGITRIGQFTCPRMRSLAELISWRPERERMEGN